MRAWRLAAMAGLGLAVAACGRWGFDAAPDDGAPDGDVDGDALPEGRWASIATSWNNACGITLAGELWCWGANWDSLLGIGQAYGASARPTRIGDASDWTQVAVEGNYQCGLRGAGDLYCWGSNNFLALGTGPIDEIAPDPVRVGAERWRAISARNRTTCGVRDTGTLWCWGRNQSGKLGRGFVSDWETMEEVSGVPMWTGVSVGEEHVCGVKGTELYCWGQNELGQLGDGGAGTNQPGLTRIAPEREWLAVSAGARHTCGIAVGGESFCWGAGWNGRLGVGFDGDVDVPVRTVAPLLASIATGDAHTCGLTADGALWCWGRAMRGAIPGRDGEQIEPQIIASGLTRVEVAGRNTCVMDGAAHVLCSGQNAYGQTGQTPGETLELARADARTDWASLAAQHQHACGTTTGGETFCWGSGLDGQLGDQSDLDRQSPVRVGTGFTSVQPGWYTTIGLKGTDLYLWGWDVQLDTSYELPVMRTTDTAVAAIGEDHGCWRTLDGGLHCAGYNDFGQLGDGTKMFNEDSVVSGTWIGVWTGDAITCATRPDGSANPRLYCWGRGDLVGITTVDDEPLPVRVVLPDLPVLDVQFGEDFACARIGAGELWCWGSNEWGKLGIGDTAPRAEPVRVGTRADWIDLDLGDWHACAIGADHALWCWGHADQGQAGTLSWEATAPMLAPGTDWVDVAAGRHNTCALKLDGTRHCAGGNENGELGNGRAWTPDLAVVP